MSPTSLGAAASVRDPLNPLGTGAMSPVPEPSRAGLLAIGLLAVGGFANRRLRRPS